MIIINSKIPKNKKVPKIYILLCHSSGLLLELVSVPVFTNIKNSQLNLLVFFEFHVQKHKYSSL